jgi:hypothetical protein
MQNRRPKSQAGFNVINLLGLVAAFAAGIGCGYFLGGSYGPQQKELAGLREQVEELEKVREETKELPKLQAKVRELEFLSKSTAELAQLRNEVRQLRDDKVQFEKTRQENQQLRASGQAQQQALVEAQRAQLQLQAESQRVQQQMQMLGRSVPAQNSCIANLKQLDGATQQWALENKLTTQTLVNPEGIKAYLRGSQLPVCPQGGQYSFSTVGQSPRCNVPGHSL